MIVRAKDKNKKIHLSEDEITLESLKECANILHPPHLPLRERVTEVSFPKRVMLEGWDKDIEGIKEASRLHTIALNEEAKVYEVLVEEVEQQMKRVAAMGLLLGSDKEIPKSEGEKNLKLEKVRFSEVYVEGLGILRIIR